MSTTPTRIRRSDPSRVVFEWADGHSAEFSAADLRRRCPCAGCVSELTGQRTLDVEAVPTDTSTREVVLVGNYAISIAFSDGHATGIYPFEMLRDSDPQG